MEHHSFFYTKNELASGIILSVRDQISGNTNVDFRS